VSNKWGTESKRDTKVENQEGESVEFYLTRLALILLDNSHLDNIIYSWAGLSFSSQLIAKSPRLCNQLGPFATRA